MLGLQPVGEHLVVDSALPAVIEELQLLDIPGRWAHRRIRPGGRWDTEKVRKRYAKRA